MAGSNLLEGLVLVFALQNEDWHSVFYSSISAPQCESKLFGTSPRTWRNSKPKPRTCNPHIIFCVLSPKSAFLPFADLLQVPPSLSLLINCEFIPGAAGIRSPRRRAGFDPAALALSKLTKNPHMD